MTHLSTQESTDSINAKKRLQQKHPKRRRSQQPSVFKHQVWMLRSASEKENNEKRTTRPKRLEYPNVRGLRSPHKSMKKYRLKFVYPEYNYAQGTGCAATLIFLVAEPFDKLRVN